jgi:hypothetical protein
MAACPGFDVVEDGFDAEWIRARRALAAALGMERFARNLHREVRGHSLERALRRSGQQAQQGQCGPAHAPHRQFWMTGGCCVRTPER